MSFVLEGSDMLCFEVELNGGPPVVAGGPDLAVLSANLTYVARRAELDLRVGGMVSKSEFDTEHVDWIHSPLKLGDTVIIRVVDSAAPLEPSARSAGDPEAERRSRRMYYEQLKREFEGED